MATRREFLKASGAAVVAAVAPVAFPVAAAQQAPAKMLAWSFDIAHGEFRDTVLAETAAEAHRFMIDEHFDCDLADDCPRRTYGNEEECTAEDCACGDSGMSEVRREPRLDGAAARGDITIDDYERAGWGHVCDRCGYEASSGEWKVIGGKPVCHECTTLDEWRIIDPQRAADIEEDARLYAEATN